MKILTYKFIQISRIILLVISLGSIPFLFFAEMFEKSSIDAQLLKYLLLPFSCVLIYFTFILHKRHQDKRKKIRSKKTYIISEFCIGLLAFIIYILPLIEILTYKTYEFDLLPLIFLVGILFCSIAIMFDNTNDFIAAMKLSK